jgi:hypothetical protein
MSAQRKLRPQAMTANDRQFDAHRRAAQRPKPSVGYVARMQGKVTLLQAYVAQRGLFSRVAKQLELDPSYVSRVADGQRHCKRITLAIEAELNKMHAASRTIPQSPSKRSVFPASRKSRLLAH